MKRIIGTFLLAATATLPVQAQTIPADEIKNCAESHFSSEDLTQMGGFFVRTEAEDEGQRPDRRIAEGRAAAMSEIGDAIVSCEIMLGASASRLETLAAYLKQLAIVRQIGFSNGAQWNAAMENYAATGVKALPETEEVSDHSRAMIVAGAHANGVPRGTEDETENSPIIAYLLAVAELKVVQAAI